jgi:hypothetical protein
MCATTENNFRPKQTKVYYTCIRPPPARAETAWGGKMATVIFYVI